MNELLSVIYRPRQIFGEVGENKVNPTMMIIILSVLVVIQAILTWPIQDQLISASGAMENVPEDQAAMAEKIMGIMRYVGLGLAVVFYIIILLIQALLLWGGVSAFQGKIDFKQSFIVVALVSFISLLGEYANLGLVFMSGVENLTGSADLYKMGLNLLADQEEAGIGILTFLASINPFQIWVIILLVIATKTISNLSTVSATILSLILWLIFTGFRVVGAVFGEMMQGRSGM